MIALGLVLFLLGLLVVGSPLLWIIGVILIVAGAASYIAPGHRHWY